MTLAGETPDRLSLEVDFDHLQNFDSEVAETLLEAPDIELENLIVELHGYPVPDGSLEGTTISISNLPDTEKIAVNKIGSANISKFVLVEGRISKISPRRAKLVEAAFQCPFCGYVLMLKQPDDRLTEPFECESVDCGRKGHFKLVHNKSTWVDEQKLELQDKYETLKPGQPMREIVVTVRGRDLINSIPAIGSQVNITGIVRTVQKTGAGGATSIFIPVLEANHIESVDVDDVDMTLTASDKVQLVGLSADPEIINKLGLSMAPSIFGYQEIKIAVLASMVSGPNRTLPDGSTLRGYVHIALCGDPGTAKTTIATAARRLAPRVQYSAGRGSTTAGLTASAVRDELSGGWTIVPGAMILSDYGYFIEDEFDKIEEGDQHALGDALESSKIDVHKAGLNQTFNTRFASLFLMNPKGIRFDDYKPLAQQLSMPGNILSRMDQVFLLQDIPEPGRDRKIAEHQMLTWSASPSEKIVPIIPTETLRKYLVYAKTFDPIIPGGVASAIVEYFLSVRGSSNGGAIPATFRENNGIARLVKCIAKLRLSNECTMGDLEIVKRLCDRARTSIIDPTSGMPDIDVLTGAPTKSQRDRVKIIKEIIQTLQGDDAAFFDEIASAAKVQGITFDHVADLLKHLKTEGDVLEMRDGFYRWVE